MSSFWETVRESIFSPEFYRSIPTRRLSDALAYFFLLIAFISFSRTYGIARVLFEDFAPQAEQFVAGFADQFPADLLVEVADGQAYTNVDEPYYVPDPVGDEYTNLLVIDTTEAFSLPAFRSYDSRLWLNKDSLIYEDSDGELTIYDLADFPDFRVDRGAIQSLVDTVQPWVKFLAPVLSVFVFLGLYIAFSFRLVYVFLVALLIWFLATVLKVRWTYGQSYVAGIYGMTAAFLVDLFIAFTERWHTFRGFEFMFTVITLSVITVNLLMARTMYAPTQAEPLE